MKSQSSHSFVLARSPLRVSIIGGGTDFEGFYKYHEGAFLSLAINRYLYCTVKKHSSTFHENIRLNYSESELVQNAEQLRNDIARVVLQKYYANSEFHKLYVGTIADLRSNSGLGSSSAFACALLQAVSKMRENKQYSPLELAKLACEIEIIELNKPIGIQDQYASAFGGFRYNRITKTGEVISEIIKLDHQQERNLNRCLYLVDTGIGRAAESITADHASPSPEQIAILEKNRRLTHEYFVNILSSNASDLPQLIGEALNISHSLKIELSHRISNTYISTMRDQILACGAIGAKISGAGGGGFILAAINPNNNTDFEKKLRNLSFNFDQIGLSKSGTEILLSEE